MALPYQERSSNRKTQPAMTNTTSLADYPLRSLEEFAQFMIKHGFLDECAYYDAEGYDGGKSLERLSKALGAVRGSALPQVWPEVPWPKEVWPTTIEEAGKLLRAKLGDNDTTAISGTLMRHGWQCAEQAFKTLLEDHQLHGIERTEVGSVTGQLRSITDFGGVYFYVWDLPSEHRIRCDISEELLPTAMAAFRKRVAAYGLIHYDRKERPKRITVEEIHAFKTENLPTVKDVIGLFSKDNG